RDRTPHRESDRPLGAALAAARARRTAGLPPSLLRVSPLHRLREAAARRAAGCKAVRARSGERQVADALTGSELAFAARSEYERIGGGGARDHVRLLTADRVEQQPVVGRDRACTQKLVALSVAPDGSCEPPLEEHRTWDGRALQGEQGRPHEDLRSDESGDRISGEPEDEGRPTHAKRKGLARLDRDPPEDLFDPQLGQDPAYEIVRSHRHAARCDEHVACETSLERLAMRRL